MSIYDNREESTYGAGNANTSDANNPLILKWWTKKHDSLLKSQILEYQWCWSSRITEEIKLLTDKGIIDGWKEVDPLCKKYAWYNILMFFAIARAEVLGFGHLIREARWIICPLCNNKFIETSLPEPFVLRLGINQLDFCSPCLRDALFNIGNTRSRKAEIVDFVRNLTHALGRVPPQDYGRGMTDLRDMTTKERKVVLEILLKKPSPYRIKVVFKNWLAALIAAGVLEGGARRTSRGTQCLAKDGHVCLSLGEKTIDDHCCPR